MALTPQTWIGAVTGIWDRFVASDPGLIRLMAGLRTVASIIATLAVLAAFQMPVQLLVAGAIAGMAATFAISDPQPRDQAITLAFGLPVALVAVTLGTLLSPYRVLQDAVFVAVIFGAVYIRRFGDRGTGLGLIGFQVFFISVFVHAAPGTLPLLYATVAVAFGCAAAVRLALVRSTPESTLMRLRGAFRARLAQVIEAQTELVGEHDAERVERLVDELRRRTGRLHECALMIQNRLDDGTRDAATAALLQRRIADAEIAAERLGVLLLKAHAYDGADTLTLHLPYAAALATATESRPPRDDVTRRLRSDLRALQVLVTRAPDDRGTAIAVLRNRLLSYREDENLPRASLAVQECFRAVGEAARAVLGLRLALDGPQDESDDTPETARSREELEAENVTMAGQAEADEEAEEKPSGLDRPSTRAAFQVALGSALAIVGGEFLSAQRWYWAVLTCWVVFINTSSLGEILVKGYRRIIGTVGGVVAGLGLAALVGHHTWTALGLALLCVFGMFFTAPLSYALMSFFVTAMLGLLYTLLNTYSTAVLVLRIEETALGATCGVIAALVVLPVRTHEHTDQQLREVLVDLREVTEAAFDQLCGGPESDLLDLARDLDTALDRLRRSTSPLTHPIAPQRARRRTVRYLVALLETCAYHARALAATAELLPQSTRIAADPRLATAGRRIARNLDVLVEHLDAEGRRPVSGDETRGTAELESPGSVAAMLEAAVYPSPGGDGPRPGSVAYRVLRHLQRLDEAVVGLARPLGVRVGDQPKRAA